MTYCLLHAYRKQRPLMLEYFRGKLQFTNPSQWVQLLAYGFAHMVKLHRGNFNGFQLHLVISCWCLVV